METEKNIQQNNFDSHSSRGTRPGYLCLLFFILFIVMVCSLSVGSADISVGDSLGIVLDRIPLIGNLIDGSGFSKSSLTVIWSVRFPRICLSALVGGILAIVGAAFQSIFRNPLADPHILGVSSGAALGATVAMLFPGITVSVAILGLGTTGVMAFVGAIISVFIVYSVAKIGGRYSTVNMLLTGTAMSTLFSSLISLFMTFHNDQIGKVYMWTMGSFSSASWPRARFVFIFAVAGVIILSALSRKLNVLALGDEEAECLGISTKKLRRAVIIISTILVAAAVSVSGIIGFVGLMMPHCVRMICGPDLRKVIPYGFFTGAIFIVICDTLARTVTAPTEIPVGIITSICGAPYFIFLVWRQYRRR
ncbi:MAG: iron ABC transporter permease [Clostridiales bacterium]|nr:iron ABC transporter permease [Clostridiales bacterium]